MRPTKFSEEQISELLALVPKSRSISDAAREIGMSPSTAQAYCNQAGIKSNFGELIDSAPVRAAVEYSVGHPELSLAKVASKFDVCSRMLSTARKRAGIPSRSEAVRKKWENFNWDGVDKIYSSMPLKRAAKAVGISPATLRKKGEEMGWERFRPAPPKEAESAESDISAHLSNWPRPPGLKEHLAELS